MHPLRQRDRLAEPSKGIAVPGNGSRPSAARRQAFAGGAGVKQGLPGRSRPIAPRPLRARRDDGQMRTPMRRHPAAAARTRPSSGCAPRGHRFRASRCRVRKARCDGNGRARWHSPLLRPGEFVQEQQYLHWRSVIRARRVRPQLAVRARVSRRRTGRGTRFVPTKRSARSGYTQLTVSTTAPVA